MEIALKANMFNKRREDQVMGKNRKKMVSRQDLIQKTWAYHYVLKATYDPYNPF